MLSEIDRARSALFHLDASCDRSTWIRAGMAAHSAGLDESTWIDWCATGANYCGEREARSVWRGIKPEGGIKAATLFHMAQAAGWHDSQTHQNGTQAARALNPKPAAQAKPQAEQKPRIDLAAAFEGYAPAGAEHPYIAAKRGTPDGLRIVPQGDPLTIRGQAVAGCLAVPVRSLDGELLTVQYIPPPGTGDKLNAPGASFGSGLFVVGEITADGRIYVCEGIGQAWSVARADYHAAAVVAFGCGRFPAVGRVLRERFPDARLVFVADRGKEDKADAIAREVGGAWVELPADKPDNYDANDYEAEHDSEALAELLQAAKTPPMRYRLQSAGDLMNAAPLRWLVRGVLPADGLAALYGPSGSGKSFLALDLCAAIADGAPDWFGRRVSAAPVTYCALEGERGMGKRAQAWGEHNGRALSRRLRFITQPLDLRQTEDIADLAAAVLAAGGRDGLLVVDTLNRAAPGADENSSKDMGELIESCKDLQRRIGGVVLLVHHTGKDGSKGMRGHSSLYAALDAAIEVARTDSRREWSLAKSKDGEDGEQQAFKLVPVELGKEEDGEPVTSCVVEAAEDSEKWVPPQPQGVTQQLVFEAIKKRLVVSSNFGKGHSPFGRPCVLLEDAIQCAGEALTCEVKRRKPLARRAIEAMMARGVYALNDGWLWVK